jgi:hypothetical protein
MRQRRRGLRGPARALRKTVLQIRWTRLRPSPGSSPAIPFLPCEQGDGAKPYHCSRTLLRGKTCAGRSTLSSLRGSATWSSSTGSTYSGSPKAAHAQMSNRLHPPRTQSASSRSPAALSSAREAGEGSGVGNWARIPGARVLRSGECAARGLVESKCSGPRLYPRPTA